MDKIKNLTCAVCNSNCKGRQWWNRDKGFGICYKCVPYVLDCEMRIYKCSETAAKQIKENYGIDGKHYFSTKEQSEVII